MTAKQQTVAAETTLEGIGLHTGAAATLRFVPASEDSGVRFVRTDLPHAPAVPARVENVTSTDRGTTVSVGDARVHTVEHLLAAVGALGLDNLIVEIDGPEVPILDGSFMPFLSALRDAGVTEQSRNAAVLVVKEAVSAQSGGGESYVAVPSDRYRISSTIEFDHPLIRRQYGSYDVNAGAFDEQIANARTFGFLKDAEALRNRGLAQGVTLDNAVVLDETKLMSGTLRWTDEFVRHKTGDIVGDLVLLGKRVRAHIIADRPSHAGNVALVQALLAAESRQGGQAPIVDIQKIMQHLPHRYPMLLVDRIIEFEQGKRIVGIKNVTINEPFFVGHYPGHPIMPGVLIIEAMAQVGGLLIMDQIENLEEKVVYFMSMDNVKWRRPVTPGDQIRFEVEVVQFRRHVARMRGVGYVDGHPAAEAEFMARIVDR
jgi:UDP-3-O-[3-hydroxymyristoyl] N-acetylglucosamine deacetylase / 3-hydroxyacyl-[acyl-carrier-protein] dehydratase